MIIGIAWFLNKALYSFVALAALTLFFFQRSDFLSKNSLLKVLRSLKNFSTTMVSNVMLLCKKSARVQNFILHSNLKRFFEAVSSITSIIDQSQLIKNLLGENKEKSIMKYCAYCAKWWLILFWLCACLPNKQNRKVFKFRNNLSD